MRKKNINKLFGEEKETAEVCARLSDSNYEGSLALAPNATFLEKSKYEICQRILAYQQSKKISVEKLAQKIQLSIPETKELLFCQIHKFTADRLITYAERLNIPLQVIEVSFSRKRVGGGFSKRTLHN
jgi:predicted XRE-type DNA-binding protein